MLTVISVVILFFLFSLYWLVYVVSRLVVRAKYPVIYESVRGGFIGFLRSRKVLDLKNPLISKLHFSFLFVEVAYYLLFIFSIFLFVFGLLSREFM